MCRCKYLSEYWACRQMCVHFIYFHLDISIYILGTRLTTHTYTRTTSHTYHTDISHTSNTPHVTHSIYGCFLFSAHNSFLSSIPLLSLSLIVLDLLYSTGTALTMCHKFCAYNILVPTSQNNHMASGNKSLSAL